MKKISVLCKMANWVFLLALCALSKTVTSVPSSRPIHSELSEIQAMTEGSHWSMKDISYDSIKYPIKLPGREADRDLEEAFKLWVSKTDFSFPDSPDHSIADIEIRFELSDHGGAGPYDGPNVTYSALTETSTLLYENATEPTDLCSDGEIDTLFSAPDGNTYVFKGDKYYRLNVDGIAFGYPRSIATDWVGLPDNIDAAFTWKNSQTYFFKGSNYWRFTNFKRDSGYPKSITQRFPGVPEGIDTAFAWSNDKAYLFKGNLYWRFDPSETSRPIESTDYPKVITLEWRGLPSNLDAVLKHSNDMTYFFKDGKYWQYNDQSDRVAEGNPAYPRPVGPWWFGC